MYNSYGSYYTIDPPCNFVYMYCVYNVYNYTLVSDLKIYGIRTET